jgi:hypothetical protein
MEALWSHFSQISLRVFSTVNTILKFFISNFVLRPSNSFLLIIALGVSALFVALTSILDFELFGSEFTFGSDLEAGVMLTVQAGWSGAIDLLRSYQPSTPLGFPLEILLEGLAGVLFLIGLVTPFVLTAIGFLVSLLLGFGLLILLEILACLYLVGGGIAIYQRFFSASGE